METERSCLVPSTCPGGIFIPSDDRFLGSYGHCSCLHAVKLPCSITCAVLHRRWLRPCKYPALWLTYNVNLLGHTALNLLCSLSSSQQPVSSSRRNCFEAALSSYWEWRHIKDNHDWMGQFHHEDVGTRAGCMGALGWFEWAEDRKLTLPLKHSADPTACGDSEQWPTQ